jgi:hypothetical protein
VKKNQLPLVGVLAALALFALAAWRYPGGYDWSRHFISTFFAPTTATGSPNHSRNIAVLAMFVFCVSVAVAFKVLSARARGKALGSTLEIGGIGSMVYGFLVVTPMHDLLIGIALLFFIPAMLAALRLAKLESRQAFFWWGLLCLVLLLTSATMYYGHVFWSMLPLVQKVSILACVSWVLAFQLAPAESVGDHGRGAS